MSFYVYRVRASDAWGSPSMYLSSTYVRRFLCKRPKIKRVIL